MFKKFLQEEQVSASTQVKSSVARGIKGKIMEQMPESEPIMDVIMPKKSPFYEIKCKDHIKIYACNGELLFFQHRDGPFYPTLKLLHKYPFMMTRQQVDKGAIKFVLSGANIMCPGLTSAGGKLTDAEAHSPCGVFAEGKEHALAVGVTKMSTNDITTVNKGIGIELVHYMNDGLWLMDPAKLNLK
eukprot:m.278626 g.278626  ORF g.278626 m.278626 type:complete len:186 (+) comp16316_c1_seq6:195-752(+)